MLIFLHLAGGLIILLIGGEFLVRGAVAISERFGVSKMMIGLTVVAIGTSLPELVVCVLAALDDAPGIAVGNVVGSNIANVLLVLGAPALIMPLVCDHRAAQRDGLYLFGATLLFAIVCATGQIDRWAGFGFLAILAGILILSYRRAVKSNDNSLAQATEEFEAVMPRSLLSSLASVGTGVVGLVLGSKLLVDGAIDLAHIAGVSEEVIGLTLVALGTSLPELATSVVAALRRHADVAMGNVIGSNLFNTLGIMGATTIVQPVPIPRSIMSFDIWVMIGVTLLLLPMLFRNWPIGRGLGIVLCGGYVLYVFAQFQGFSGIANAAG
ncbi:calcium/sodium antiporter [Oceanibacterium hippocampi]|uniref:Inner membrane protein YrbG n=1 Tax=Oceanibacterium hippocampi TaxID=745714 RepID=A0A1Y5TYT6_9PROT|nr:calcium/sodium antiporter [Oceanibacterium hippocampi]SLN74380.1 Inner membrane protein YrbG [Oceanibacterium hippocampi]